VGEKQVLDLRLRLIARVVDDDLLSAGGLRLVHVQLLLARDENSVVDRARIGLDRGQNLVERLRLRLRPVGAQGLQSQPDERCNDDQREERAAEETIH